MDKGKFEKFFHAFIEGLKKLLDKVIKFIKKHKVFSASVAVVFVLVFAVVLFVMDKLNRIDYDDGSNPSVVYQESTASSIAAENSTTASVTAYNMEDGSVVFLDGSYINALGAAVLKDGTTIYPTQIVVFQDGSFFENTGITVKQDGTATFSNGKQLHITSFYIQKDGKVMSADENGKLIEIDNILPMLNNSSGNSGDNAAELPVTEPEDDSDNNFDQYLEEIMVDDALRDTFDQNDKLIEENAKNNEIWYSDDVINILVMGIDNGSQLHPYGRSDAMMVASVNKNTKSVKIVSLARVSYVAIEGYKNTRLSHAHGYGGPLLAMDTVEKNFKIRIDNYISTTFDNFQKIIDSFGGVDIALTKAEVEDETMQFVLKRMGYDPKQAGVYTLDGYAALNYARLRSIDSDRQRTSRQRNIIDALANKAKNMNFLQLNTLLNEILGYVKTDLTRTEIAAQLWNVPTYLSNPIVQDVLPQKYGEVTTDDNGFGVAFIDWNTEIAYAHKLFYDGVTVQYMIG